MSEKSVGVAPQRAPCSAKSVSRSVVECGRVGESRRYDSVPGERGLPAPELLPEVSAAAGQVLVPGRRECQRRARLAPPGASAEERRPALVAGELLAEKDVPLERVERGPQAACGSDLRAAREHGAELVPWSVAEKPEHPREAPTPGIDREDGSKSSMGIASDVKQQLAVGAVVLPPHTVPERGREDPTGALGERVPLALDVLEPGDGLRAR